MKRKFMKYTASVMLIVCLFVFWGSLTSSAAETPYQSYTYWEGMKADRTAVYNRSMYQVSRVIDAKTLGTLRFEQINNVTTDSEGNIYILDQTSRIAVLDKNYQFVRGIGAISDDSGTAYDYTGAKNLYIDKNKRLYICDTENHRVLVSDLNAKLLDIYTLPDSSLIPEQFEFNPIDIAVDSNGYVYVVCNGSYYGALLYSPDKSFEGFFGSNRVNASVSDALSNALSRIFVNNKKKSASAQLLPYSFVDITVDEQDFVYTVTGYTEKYDNMGQIKRLNPGNGENILESDNVNFTDDTINTTKLKGTAVNQNLVAVEVDKDGFIYALESQFGRVYVYDRECRMITAFGGGLGEGTQKGSFMQAAALTLNGSDVLVLDKVKNTVTVFSPSDYGTAVKQADLLTLNGKYTDAKPLWENVLKQDKNLQIAYCGIARAYLAEGDYREAMHMAKQGYDRKTYSLAFEQQRKEIVNNYFGIFAVAVIAIVAAAVAGLVIAKKKQLVLVKNKTVSFMFRSMVHPAVCFEEVQYKKKGSWICCGVLVLLYYLLTISRTLFGGFTFTMFDAGSYHSLWVLLQTAGMAVLWIVCNWMISTLFSGKGRIREIAVVTCYSLQPLIIESALYLILSNCLLESEGAFIGILHTVAVLYALLLLIIGMLRIHEYSMSKFVGTAVLTLFAMAVIIFCMMMVIILLQQLGGFLATVLVELTM